jgi:hypothetical protein
MKDTRQWANFGVPPCRSIFNDACTNLDWIPVTYEEKKAIRDGRLLAWATLPLSKLHLRQTNQVFKYLDAVSFLAEFISAGMVATIWLMSQKV